MVILISLATTGCMSRKIVSIGIAVAVAVAFLFVGAGAVAAHDGGNDVGVSGHCSDDTTGQEGGGGSVGVSNDGDPSQDDVDATNPTEVQSVIAGLQLFFSEQQGDGECGTDNTDEDSYDYLEAHASGDPGQVQACFSQDTDNSDPPISAGQGDQCHA